MRQYLVRELIFFIMKLVFFGENVSFIYSAGTLFSKIVYYLSRLNRALKLKSFICSQKTYVFLNFVEKDVRLKWKKRVNVIITIITEYAWICLNVPK